MIFRVVSRKAVSSTSTAEDRQLIIIHDFVLRKGYHPARQIFVLLVQWQNISTSYIPVLFRGNFEYINIIFPIQKVFNFRKVSSCNLESFKTCQVEARQHIKVLKGNVNTTMTGSLQLMLLLLLMSAVEMNERFQYYQNYRYNWQVPGNEHQTLNDIIFHENRIIIFMTNSKVFQYQ